jgi:hypothetical protein
MPIMTTQLLNIAALTLLLSLNAQADGMVPTPPW